MKGYCEISQQLPFCNIIKDIDLDCMHGFALNIVKHFLVLWFSEKYQNEAFSLYNKLTWANQVTLNFKFPHINTRSTRELKNFDEWKASELQNWMLVIGKALLKQIMQPEYYFHTCLLIDGYTLLFKPFSRQDLINAKEKVQFFCDILHINK